MAFGALGGWFSKITTDKLQEVFETLFKTDKDAARKNKLRATARPVLAKAIPNPVPQGAQDLVLEGENFLAGATVLLDGLELPASLKDGKLTVSLAQLTPWPTVGQKAVLKVKNPEGREPESDALEVVFG